MKQYDMAKALGISPSYLCMIEKGVMEPTEEFKNNCAEYFNISPVILFPDNPGKIKKINNNSNFNNMLWSIRIEKGIKQYELARLLQCSPSYLSKVEKGIKKPNDRFKKRCAKALKIKEVELFP